MVTLLLPLPLPLPLPLLPTPTPTPNPTPSHTPNFNSIPSSNAHPNPNQAQPNAGWPVHAARIVRDLVSSSRGACLCATSKRRRSALTDALHALRALTAPYMYMRDVEPPQPTRRNARRGGARGGAGASADLDSDPQVRLRPDARTFRPQAEREL